MSESCKALSCKALSCKALKNVELIRECISRTALHRERLIKGCVHRGNNVTCDEYQHCYNCPIFKIMPGITTDVKSCQASHHCIETEATPGVLNIHKIMKKWCKIHLNKGMNV